MTRAFIALGANLGDRLATIQAAIGALAKLGKVNAISSIYETDPVGLTEQPSYLNAVLELETELTADDLLAALLNIEREHGRERTFRNAPRTLDLDLVLFGDDRRKSERLTLPHPRMHERAFVLVPLAEIAPDLVIAGPNATVTELLARQDPDSGVRRFAPQVPGDRQS